MSPICKQCGQEVSRLRYYQGQFICAGCVDKNDDRRDQLICQIIKEHKRIGLTELLACLKAKGLNVPRTTLHDLLNGQNCPKGIKRSGTEYFVEE